MLTETEVRIPIIKLYDTLIVTIQVELSDRLVIQLKEDIGKEIQRLGPTGLVIDVSGVQIIDSYISRAVRDIGLMSRLMGVEAVITGLDPNIAIALTEMGLDLEGVQTHMDLESAFESLQGIGTPSGEGGELRVIEDGGSLPSADGTTGEESWWWR